MKREELKTYYKTSCHEPTEEFYCKDDADKVMDALEYDIRIYQDIVSKEEARIKELEHKLNQMCWENDSLKDECNKADERINELEAANIKCQEHRELIESENATLTKMINERIERVKELKDYLQVANRCAEEARERIKELESKEAELECWRDGNIIAECHQVYINQLRYERLMAKAMYFGILAYHYACEGDKKDSAKGKCDRIYIALKARAKKIKEGM